MPHELTHEEASRRAHQNVERHGGEAVSAPARAAFLRRFEQQIEGYAPGLRERDPEEFWKRVAAARSSYFGFLAIKRIEKAEAERGARAPRCPLCAAGHIGIVPVELVSDATASLLCSKHRLSWQRALRRATQH